METIEGFLNNLSSVIWGPFLLIPLLLATGVYLTARLRGIQFTHLIAALKLGFTKSDESAEGDISHYQALSTALAATVGVGNIAGVATAIHLGGPGALFWMWVTALLGMATKYSEAFLGVRFRRPDSKGEMSGGPMFYLRDGVGGPLGKVLGIFFAIAGAIAAFGIGNMVQTNTVAQSISDEFGVPTVATGIVLTIGVAAVILGGIKTIGRVSAAFVPVMIVFYVIGAAAVLLLNITELPSALWLVISDAFTGTAAVGGFLGATIAKAIQYGVARGIFSNESGLGTGGIAAAAARSSHPSRQALVSMTQTFIDTIIVVSATGLTIVVTGAWETGQTASLLTAEAFNRGLPGDVGGLIVTIGVVFFAFSTVLGWSYYGERCMDMLVGRRAVLPYRVLFVIAAFVGCVTELTVVWTFADVANGLMALPNLVGLLLLSGLVARETRAYLAEGEKDVAKTLV